MADGVYVLIPASEYAEMESKIECLEKALDKACEVLEEVYVPCCDLDARRHNHNKEQWKEWCMNDD